MVCQKVSLFASEKPKFCGGTDVLLEHSRKWVDLISQPRVSMSHELVPTN